MNIFFTMGIIAVCTAVFAGVVAFLTMHGVHVLLAVLGVYLFAVWTMLSMQRTARDIFENGKMRGYADSDSRRTRVQPVGNADNVYSLSRD